MGPKVAAARARGALEVSGSRDLPVVAVASSTAPARRPLLAPGATLRAAIDPVSPSASTLVGALVEIRSRVRLCAAAIVGDVKGGYAGATLRFGRGRLHPLVAAGVPVFFADGARPGVRGAVGVSWSPISPVDIVLEIGGEHFFSAPDRYRRDLFVPALAVEVTR